ncbi:hypothetical protein TRAPUB_6246 [Trametes pubescens]|uniref:Uncharacterized protein n=1 Tax=Trametes pubescens TaxID=154538 RepID=A0A1M2V6G7_TRAPU|nr:hypothetical protein TRAPUB_6246 [Trametes pubescens]
MPGDAIVTSPKVDLPPARAPVCAGKPQAPSTGRLSRAVCVFGETVSVEALTGSQRTARSGRGRWEEARSLKESWNWGAPSWADGIGFTR